MDLADNSKSDPALVAGVAGRPTTDADSTQPPEPAVFSNAAHLYTGQTEVLVAPGLDQTSQQHQAHLQQSGQATADKQSDSEASLPAAQHAELTLDLGGDNDADVPLTESRPEILDAPATQNVVDPDLQAAQIPADTSAEVEEQLEGDEAGGSQPEAECDMHSIASDGADLYQGLLVDQLGQQAAVTSPSVRDTDNGNPAEDVSMPSDGDAEIHSEADKDQQQQQQQVDADIHSEADKDQRQQQQLELGGDTAEAAAMEDALPQSAPEPAGETVNEQQLAQTGAPVPAAGSSLDNLQAAMPDSDVEAAQTTVQVNDPSSLAGTVESSQTVAQPGTWVEVCSRPAVGQWSWQQASLQAAALPASGLVSGTYKASPSELPFSVKSELVNAYNVRHMAPSDTYIKALSEVQRGAAVEVDMGDGKFMCGVLVAKTQHLHTALGQQPGIAGLIQGFERTLENPNTLLPSKTITCLCICPIDYLHQTDLSCVMCVCPNVLCAHAFSDYVNRCLIHSDAAGF